MTTARRMQKVRKGKPDVLKAAAKRAENMARYAAFMYDLLDSGLSNHVYAKFVQHDGAENFYATVSVNNKDIAHDRLESLIALAKKHDGVVNINDGIPEVFLGRD